MATTINKVIYGNQVLIDLTNDTVTAADLASGKTAHDKSGARITGTNTYDSTTTDATATASEILATKTAYVNKNKVTGTMTNNGAVTGTISTKGGTYTIPQGYHDGSGTVSINATEQNKIIASNIKSGVQILGVTGSYGGEEVTAEAVSNINAYTDVQRVITPSEGYDYISQVTINPIAFTTVENSYGGLTATIGTVSPANQLTQ